ncbi:hypothetical protein PHLH8_15060 [Pseudomonas sp. Pc102]|uniref:CSLREA domain-containing protein n=1 Tax=Pseudomonas sp. Pc102 TaxID=2678261 RepID=UPI001BCA902D|nr:CSLREA domain-containing protein [Pseudomonas sp. Pc102]BBP81864.1 hypothetical protein PHLH8_15060 [Pseudomonas sp. Pc102]
MHKTLISPLATAVLVALAVGGQAAHAADFVVNQTEDSYDGVCDAHCSLRDAISAANAAPGPDRIVLQAQTYRLSLPAGRDEEGDVVDEDDNLNGDLDIHDSLEIIGQGPAATVISGTPQANDRLLEVFDGARVVLERLRLTGGHSSTYGGALENHGEVVLRQVEVSRNSSTGAFSPGNGGGIANDGRLAVHRSVIANNRAGAGEGYFGLGGGIYNTGELLLRDSSVQGNSASDDDDAGYGGGLYNRGTADVARTTFSGNGSSFGSAIGNDGTLTLVNSTLSGNTQYYRAQATLNNGQPWISASPEALLVNVTIANNSGGYGLINTGSVTLRNSIIAGNLDEGLETPMNCDNQGAQAQYKAIGLLLGTGPGNCTGELYVEQTDVLTKVLYPLADNNGLTQTHALRPRSPAVDAGIGTCTAHDQRGSKRPRDGDGDGVARCDLGAYERPKP